MPQHQDLLTVWCDGKPTPMPTWLRLRSCSLSREAMTLRNFLLSKTCKFSMPIKLTLYTSLYTMGSWWGASHLPKLTYCSLTLAAICCLHSVQSVAE